MCFKANASIFGLVETVRYVSFLYIHGSSWL